MRLRLTSSSSADKWEQVMLGMLRKDKSKYNQELKFDIKYNKNLDELLKKRQEAVDKKEYQSVTIQNSPREMEIINKVNSIPILNNCLDKDLFQKRVDRLHPKVISHIENDLADYII